MAQPQQQNPPKLFALSVDGGGVRTLLSARFIFQLEQKLREWTGQNDLTMGQFFTCVAGGSTGALVAVSIAAGTEASKTVEFFNDVSNIFPESDSSGWSPAWSPTSFLKSLFAPTFREVSQRTGLALDAAMKPRYERDALDKLLVKLFGDNTLGNAICRVVVPVYELETQQPRTFSRADANVRMHEVVGAAFSAPLIFPPTKILRGTEHKRYSDGFLFANNPAMSLVSYLIGNHVVDSVANLFVISIGTRNVAQPEPVIEAGDDHSLLKYGATVDALSDGATLMADCQAREILGDSNYVRVALPIGGDIPYDTTDAEIIAQLYNEPIPEDYWEPLKQALKNFDPARFPNI